MMCVEAEGGDFCTVVFTRIDNSSCQYFEKASLRWSWRVDHLPHSISPHVQQDVIREYDIPGYATAQSVVPDGICGS